MSEGYEVGYKKPPKHTRFQKGQSGNPNGRPKGSKNLATDLMEEMQEQIQVREGSTPKRLSKQRAMVKSLMAKAIKGDPRAVGQIVNILWRVQDQNGAQNAEEALSADEDEVLTAMQARFSNRRLANSEGKTGVRLVESTRSGGKDDDPCP